jgi:hypothetical protein
MDQSVRGWPSQFATGDALVRDGVDVCGKTFDSEPLAPYRSDPQPNDPAGGADDESATRFD